MANITTADVRAYVTQRQAEGAANVTINRELSALKRMFTLACQAGKLLVSPHIPMLQENNVRRGFFEREQFESVRNRLPPELWPVVTFGYLTGWRINSEVLTLQWHQVDLRAGIVRLDPGTTKNREGRTFPFSALPELRDLIEEQRAATTILEHKTGTIVPWVLTVTAGPSSSIVAPGCVHAGKQGVRVGSRMTSDARPFEISSARVCQSVWR